MIRDYLYTYVKLFELRGVTAVLTSEMEQVTGPLGMTDINFAFVLDTVIYLGFCEVDSQMRRVIMVLKQRGSGHETHLRELILAPDGPKIGTKFVGLSGVTGGVATGSYQVTIDEMIQPLTFIQGFAEQLRAGRVPPEQQRKLLEQMTVQSNRMIDYLCEYFGIDRAKLLEKK
jgi:circadian clock protein KaiC